MVRHKIDITLIIAVILLCTNSLFAQLTVNVSTTDATCYGFCNATATANPSNGVPPYTYLWSPLPDTTQNIANLCAFGGYSSIVIDSNNDTVTTGFSIPEPAELVMSLASVNVSCPPNCCNASLTAIPVGGTQPYTYLWSDPAAQTDSTADSLCGGMYFVTVTDFNGCITVDSALVSQTMELTTSVSISTGISCYNSCDGALVANPSGGTAPYLYQWDDPFTQTSQTATGLCAGTFMVTVTDSLDSVSSVSVTITEPPVLNGLITSINDATCPTYCDGNATVSVSGGIGAYTYAWTTSPVQTNAMATGLCAGMYLVAVSDSNGCSVADSVMINEPAPLSVNISGLSSTCSGDCSGEAIVSTTGGAPPYSFLWDDPSAQTDSIADSLCVGTYTITVIDANGCSDTASATVIADSLVTSGFTFWPTSQCLSGNNFCFTNTGDLGVSYFWDFGDGIGTSTMESPCYTYTSAGFYTVTQIVSQGACSDSTAWVTQVHSEPTTTLTVTAVLCNGNCDGSVNLTISGGTSPYSFCFTNGVPCGGCGSCCSSSWFGSSVCSLLPGSDLLCAGMHYLALSDANGCMVQDSVMVPEPNILALTMGSFDACGISDGKAYVITSGGTPPFSYMWDDPSSQTSDTATGLAAGTYNVLVTDANGCTAFDSISVIDSGSVSVSIPSFTNMSCNGVCNGTATASFVCGVFPYSYQWDDPLNQTTQMATGLCAGNYMVLVTDSTGQSDSAVISITEPSLITNSVLAEICDNDSIMLEGSYQNTSGTYNDTLTSANGCDSISVTSLTVNPLPTVNLGADTMICNGCSVTLDAEIGFTSYIWSTGENTQAINVDSTGTYVVQVTDTNGCMGGDTIVVNIVSGTNQTTITNHESLIVHPNPTPGRFTLQMSFPKNMEVSVKVLEYTGRQIYSEQIYDLNGNYSKQIDLSDYSKGIYFLQVSTKSGILTRKIVLY